ncbi:prion-inhibition and propagation-domain-containing protein [Echria macrotheca]|uniref:Prion-inhibition and propagation-domain-containing protein n=1 Tax=Echria macrotheca TaxID=438768 RepID=A0AAJ0FAP0_9PEZI|nr:prion-inhibition and propagation-domain-containing protein [Echria macrotheca]
MAEVFGIVSGAIGIASAFSACVEVFGYVQEGRHFGRDYETSHLRLTLLRLRLSRWGSAVDIYNDPKLGRPSADDSEIGVAKDTLFQILVLFEDSKRVSDRFKLKDDDPEAANSGKSSSQHPLSNAPGGSTTIPLPSRADNKMSAVATQRQKHSNVLKLAAWAIHHSKALSRLLDDLSELIGSLEQLFPPPPARLAQLTAGELAEADGQEEIQVLTTAAEGIDPALHAAAAQLTGHQYMEIEVDAGIDGLVINGNTYTSNDNTGAVSGRTSHLYRGISIKGTKGLTVLNGNKHGAGRLRASR